MHMTDEEDDAVAEKNVEKDKHTAETRTEPVLRGKVLLIDDSPSTCKYSAKVLRLNHIEVLCAKSAKAGYDLGIRHRHEIVLILIDLIMPKVDGLECLSWFREHHILSQIPVFMLSCNHSSEPEMIELCRSAGAMDLLGKPFNSDALDIILHNYALVTIPDSPEPEEEVEEEEEVPENVGRALASSANNKVPSSGTISSSGNSYRFNTPATIPVRPRNILPSKKIIRPAQIKYIHSSSFNDSTIVYGESVPVGEAPLGSRVLPTTGANSRAATSKTNAVSGSPSRGSDVIVGGSSSGSSGLSPNTGKVSTDEERHHHGPTGHREISGHSPLCIEEEGSRVLLNDSSSTVINNNNNDGKGPETTTATEEQEESDVSPPPLHVLLIHDSSLCSTVAAHQLTAAGYSLTLTNNCQHAYELLCATPYLYSVVMYDVIMPVNDGVALLQLMREDQSVLREVTFVMLSGLQGDEYSERCATMGVTAVLKKPFSLEKFKYAVQPYLQHHI